MVLRLDRIAIEETAEASGGDPERIANAILDQMTNYSGPIPVCDIARALDILDIREERLTSLEGALLITPSKGYGAILLNANSTPQRRRYTLGHELCHFLHPWHWPISSARFNCTSRDMQETAGSDQHALQETQANHFAIELLAPKRLFDFDLHSTPDIAVINDMAQRFDISRAAAARRYAEMHNEDLTVVFSRHGIIDYAVTPPQVPNKVSWRGKALPVQIEQRPGQVSPWIDADPADWNLAPCAHVRIQTLQQLDGHALTLVHVQIPEGT